MSATNWAICPRCKDRMRVKVERNTQKLFESYGKVSVEEFNELQAEHGQKLATLENPEVSLREDYEIFIDNDDNKFRVYYGAKCECGFEYSFTHEEAITITPPAGEDKKE